MVRCEVTIDNEFLKQNICDCIRILGGEPVVIGDNVSVTVSENQDKMIELFEQFGDHSIIITP